MPINQKEAQFFANELKDCGASIVCASLRSGDPFWRSMVGCGWLQEVALIGRQEALGQPLFELHEAADPKDAVDFVKALKDNLTTADFSALIAGDPKPTKAWSAPMAWIQGVGRSRTAEAANHRASVVCALLPEVKGVPDLFRVQRTGQYIVSMQRLASNSQKLDFAHSAMSLAIAGDLSRDTPDISVPGDDRYAGAKLVKQLMSCGVQPDLPAAKLLFKVLRRDEARQWMSWMANQEGGLEFSQAMIKRGARLRPDPDLVAHFQAMMAHAAISAVRRPMQACATP